MSRWWLLVSLALDVVVVAVNVVSLAPDAGANLVSRRPRRLRAARDQLWVRAIPAAHRRRSGQKRRRWKEGELEISQEHFASNLIRGRLLALARLWGRGAGPLALLACAPGEQHDISLIIFGLLLRSYGWRILFLGADTPLRTLEDTAKTTAPDVVVLVTFDQARLEAGGTTLRRLGRVAPLFLSGPGASPEISAKLRVPRLNGDLVEAAGELARMPNG